MFLCLESTPSGNACDYTETRFERNGDSFTGFRVYTRRGQMLPQNAEDLCHRDGGYLPILNTTTRNELLLKTIQRYGKT